MGRVVCGSSKSSSAEGLCKGLDEAMERVLVLGLDLPECGFWQLCNLGKVDIPLRAWALSAIQLTYGCLL